MRARTALLAGALAGIVLGCLIGAVLWTHGDGSGSASPVSGTTRRREQMPAGELTGPQILDRVARAYRSCESYRDSGVVRIVFIESEGSRRTVERPFKTAFVRPDHFRFEYSKESFGRQVRYIICADGREVLTWWDIRPGVQENTSLSRALAGATGVSAGSAHRIPALLMPREVGGHRLTDLPRPKRIEDGQTDGNPCFRVETVFLGRRTTTWVGKGTFAVLRVEERYSLPGARAETTTTYRPAFDADIPADLLEFSAPGTGGGGLRR